MEAVPYPCLTTVSSVLITAVTFLLLTRSSMYVPLHQYLHEYTLLYIAIVPLTVLLHAASLT